MKIVLFLVLIVFSVAAAAESAYYSSDSGILLIPQALEDEVYPHGEVKIHLDVNTGKFDELGRVDIQQFTDSNNGNHVSRFSNQTQILTIPFANTDHQYFYRDVQILLDFTTGEFNILGGTEISVPNTPFVINSKVYDNVRFYNGQEIEIKNVTDTRCPTSSICDDPGEFAVSLASSLTAFGGDFRYVGLPGIGGGSGETTTLGDFKITILDVLPYPEAADHNISVEDYEIVFMYEYIGGQ